MTIQEMKARFDDQAVPAIEKLFIKTLIDGLKGDSVKAAEFVLNRIIGKPKEEIDHNIETSVTVLSEQFDDRLSYLKDAK